MNGTGSCPWPSPVNSDIPIRDIGLGPIVPQPSKKTNGSSIWHTGPFLHRLRKQVAYCMLPKKIKCPSGRYRSKKAKEALEDVLHEAINALKAEKLLKVTKAMKSDEEQISPNAHLRQALTYKPEQHDIAERTRRD